MARVWIIILMVIAISAQSAYAVPPRTPSAQAQGQAKQPRKIAPRDQVRSLDEWFQILQVAPDVASASHVAGKILEIWSASKSDTVNLLMLRAKIAFEARKIDESIAVLSGLVRAYPDYLEARNRRAQLYLMKQDIGEALEDMQYILKREPRHFQVLMGLGMLLLQVGEERKAYVVFRRVLEIYPNIELDPNIRDFIRKLEVEVEGQPI